MIGSIRSVVQFLDQYPQEGGGTATAAAVWHEGFGALGVEASMVGRGDLRRRSLPVADLALIHGGLSPSSIVARMRLRSAASIVALPWDPYDETMFDSSRVRKRLYFAAIERNYLRTVSAVHACDGRMGRSLIDLGVKTRTVTSPLGLLDADARAAASVAEDDGYQGHVGYLGRYNIHQKGLDILAAVWRRDLSHENDLRLCLAGGAGGGEGAVSELFAGLGNVSVSGVVGSKWDALADLDVLVLPSRSEGFGLVALEAAASGRAVVVSVGAPAAGWLSRFPGVVTVAPTIDGLAAGLARVRADGEALRREAVSSSVEVRSCFGSKAAAESLLRAVPVDVG